MNRRRAGLAKIFAGGAVLMLVAAACGGGAGSGSDYTIGVSNTLQGNGWREQMICSMKAEALASGKVASMNIINRNANTAEQIEDLKSLISAGVDAIVLNPTSVDALDDVIKEATDKGIVVVAVDQAVNAPTAYVVANDQENYGYLGAKWLFEKLGKKGNVIYMRGIDGVPADSDRDKGFDRAAAEYPDIKVVKEVFTGWDPVQGAQQINDIFASGETFDGIWTSGIDIPIVEAFKTAGKDFVPVVGADNNQFVAYLDSEKANGLTGAAVTNPPPVGGAGVYQALKVLAGEKPDRVTLLTPEVWDNSTDDGLKTIQGAHDPDLNPYYGVTYAIPGMSSYDKAALIACKGPGEE